MTIAELGSLGEFFGSIAVLVTLLYLAAQVRSARSAITSQAHATRADVAWRSAESVYNSPYMPDLFSRTVFRAEPPDELTREEVTRFMHFVQGNLRVFENFFTQHRMGVLGADVLDAHRTSLAGPLFMGNNLGRAQWTVARATFEPEFAAWVDEIIAEGPPLLVIPSPLPDDIANIAR